MNKRKYKLNESYFEKVDSEDKAYFLGLLYADGNHTRSKRKNTIRLQLHKKDVDILYKFNKYLSHEKPIYFSKNMATIEIASKKCSEDALKLGLVPRKTFVLKFPDFLDDSLVSHFIRGYFDGDGAILKSKANAKFRQKTDIFSLSIVGTKEMCLSIEKIFKIKCDANVYWTQRFPERNMNNYQIACGGRHQLDRVLQYLYKNATVYLDRKYYRFKEHEEEYKRIHYIN